MSLPEKITITLNLIDGTRRQFVFEPPQNQEMRIAARVKSFLELPTVAIQLPDKLLMIPKSQIRSIEFAPPLQKQIDGIFGNAEELKVN